MGRMGRGAAPRLRGGQTKRADRFDNVNCALIGWVELDYAKGRAGARQFCIANLARTAATVGTVYLSVLLQLQNDDAHVRIVYKDFPILGDDSMQAA